MNLILDGMNLSLNRANYARMEMSEGDTLIVAVGPSQAKLEFRVRDGEWILFAPTDIKVIQDNVCPPLS